MRAEQILPDHVDKIDVNGTTVRKGTVAAFLANARIWTDEGASEDARAHAGADIVEGLPALRAIGLFDVLEIRDVSLRNWLDAH
ncbi:hypothetical protein R69658_04672 [Paraburkholderia aspalathi]|jgi:hypothetical protein|uniref:Preprotein translocase subunit SecD n=1 Tax=Paraburkholderia aspalathi TaxID=1324617 RepID=A0ABN7MCC5_9BURK|nr:hypothetical protein [Paraburkholderia aspalathi]MBK3821148.1 hypothetical protein [Paraburkholderia aspalathi]MBK3832937.1 hypothetical protein [Paraburkholderia aspalathi]MBK3862705.1 hypothetical protein [Paraburkholderia aspalathi]CAE6794690.1 hypothetical protein R69658_04672 [Paraburkholderia aspalathi]